MGCCASRCRCRVRLSTLHYCPCCCSVTVSAEDLPVLDHERMSKWSSVCEIAVGREVPFTSKQRGERKSVVRVVTLADTHTRHSSLAMPKGDILLFAGDFTKWKTCARDVDEAIAWFKTLIDEGTYQHICVICGNHEVAFNPSKAEQTAARFHYTKKKHRLETDTVPNETDKLADDCKYYESDNCDESESEPMADGCIHYLQDSWVDLFGLRIYGTPWHVKRGCLYQANAFDKGVSALKRIHAEIDDSTDILLSHCPPHGLGDLEYPGNVGSRSLLDEALRRVKPLLHVYGHCHGGRGMRFVEGSRTAFFNTACAPRKFDFVFDKPKSLQSAIEIDI